MPKKRLVHAQGRSTVPVKTVSVLWTQEDLASLFFGRKLKNRAVNGEAVKEGERLGKQVNGCSVLGEHNSAQCVPLQIKFHMPQLGGFWTSHLCLPAFLQRGDRWHSSHYTF